jgi:hypothetical protein
MIWFFERNNEIIQLETRYDNVTREFVAVIRPPQGVEQVEHFTNEAAFRARLIELERKLDADRWVQKGGPTVLPDGWPMRPPD